MSPIPETDGVQPAADIDLGVAGAADADGGPLGGQLVEVELADAAERGAEGADPAARVDRAGSVVAELEFVDVDVEELDLAGTVSVEAAQARQIVWRPEVAPTGFPFSAAAIRRPAAELLEQDGFDRPSRRRQRRTGHGARHVADS